MYRLASYTFGKRKEIYICFLLRQVQAGKPRLNILKNQVSETGVRRKIGTCNPGCLILNPCSSLSRFAFRGNTETHDLN